MSKKKALIITDETNDIQLIAKTLSEVLDDFKVTTCAAEKFEGTDLLAADMFLIGCEEPNPVSFSYLQEMLAHINLASRGCGVFSTKQNTLKYLQDITHDCEAFSLEPLNVQADNVKKADIKKWLKGFEK